MKDDLKLCTSLFTPYRAQITIWTDGNQKYPSARNVYNALGYYGGFNRSTLFGKVFENHSFVLIKKRAFSRTQYFFYLDRIVPILQSYIQLTHNYECEPNAIRYYVLRNREVCYNAEQLIEMFNTKVFGKPSSVNVKTNTLTDKEPNEDNTATEVQPKNETNTTAEPAIDATADTSAAETAAEPVTADTAAAETVESAVDDTTAETAIDTTPAVVDAESISLDERATRIQYLLNDIRANCIRVGFELIAAKKLVNHGDWGKWLADNFSADYGLSVRTAQNYMNVAERFGGDDSFARIEHSKLILMTKLPKYTEKKFLNEQIILYGKSVSEQSWRQVKKHVAEFKRACHGTTPAQVETIDATAKNTPVIVDTNADIENLRRIIAELRAENDALKRDNSILLDENKALRSELAARETAVEERRKLRLRQ